ncbi:hypothetical protein [Bacillus paralicheniformis]|uniref:hypothetical protein n=1 Tax=Bacillus paralicheniformis TaxID=1648923 RepID=UPI001645FB10|nr:hypothetical protein [Bacillus paralicheniformis]
MIDILIYVGIAIGVLILLGLVLSGIAFIRLYLLSSKVAKETLNDFQQHLEEKRK